MERDVRLDHPAMLGIDDSQLTRESWKVFQIMAEFVEGFERLARIKPSVSIFGSARTATDHPYYELAENIARVFHHELEQPIADRSTARLVRVRIRETRKNSFVYGAME